MSKIGILHPGEMGVSVAASAMKSGHQVYWASEGRSSKTRWRAAQRNLAELNTLQELCQKCEIILSVCPPHEAEAIARSVIEADFKGLYLDANAISPQRSIEIGKYMEAATIHFVDGGIIGGPAWNPDDTWLYLSGSHANEIALCFSGGPLETKIIGTEIGKASALKMCYAAYSKGTTALLAAVLATAETLHVQEELFEQWDADTPSFSDQVSQRVRQVTTKAWRFEGEMIEIASTFRAAGLPSGFHESAAEIYQRLARFKDADEIPTFLDVLASLSAK